MVANVIPPRSVWYGWGDPALKKALSGPTWMALKALRGVTPDVKDHPPIALDDIVLPNPQLEDAALAGLRDIVGAEHVSQSQLDRVEHAGGKSYVDLYRARTGEISDPPDAVVYPGSSSEVAELIRYCSDAGIAVVPFGGGTSVVGGVNAFRGGFDAVISVDMRRLNRVISVDEISRTAKVEAGIRGPELEQELATYGLTLGHFPQSFEQATIGGYLVTRSSGQASSGYGRFEENVMALTLATAQGELTLGGCTPALATAAGPKLLDVVIGSEGILGVVTEVTLQLHAAPTVFENASWVFPSMDDGFAAFRQLAQDLGHGVMPDVSRLSDPEETLMTLLQSGSGLRALGRRKLKAEKPVLGVFQWEGHDTADLRYRRRLAEKVLSAHGGSKISSSIAEHWMSHRFHGPYQRDHLMDRGVFVETLETATTWSNISNVYTSVRDAIHQAIGEHAVIQCHVSHLYDGGASLYFTYFAREEAQPLDQWKRVKHAANEAIAAAGGTTTHHHAVGIDHREWASAEMGELGRAVLAAAKRALDPAGVLNPGKLLDLVSRETDSHE